MVELAWQPHWDVVFWSSGEELLALTGMVQSPNVICTLKTKIIRRKFKKYASDNFVAKSLLLILFLSNVIFVNFVDLLSGLPVFRFVFLCAGTGKQKQFTYN